MPQVFSTFVTVPVLADNLDRPNWVVVDCRFDLADTGAGRLAYERGHIPGAVYAHLDRDLSGPPETDAGRHPLPAPQELVNRFRRLGIRRDSQVVAYDDVGGMIAGRLWWMLRYMGHEAVAILNGGWAAWVEAGLQVVSGQENRPPGDFAGAPRRDRLVLLDEVPAQGMLIDARAPARYRGDEEPLDSRAGHIPGARNHFYGLNLDDTGRLRPVAELQARFGEILDTPDSGTVTVYCGSGVSACLNIAAMIHAGFPEPRLYVGSWSEWSADPGRPAATGDD